MGGHSWISAAARDSQRWPRYISALRRLSHRISTRIRCGLRRQPSHYASGSQFAVHRASVFDLPQDQYDVVHSWGVLHHTGDMWRAIRTSALRVKPNGIYAIAIYLKTP